MEKRKSIIVRLTTGEIEVMKRAAKKAGLNQQRFCAMAIMGKQVIEYPAIKELSIDLKRIGTNLNQMTMLAHQNKTPDPLEAENLQKELSEIWQSLKLLIQKQV